MPELVNWYIHENMNKSHPADLKDVELIPRLLSASLDHPILTAANQRWSLEKTANQNEFQLNFESVNNKIFV